MGSHGWQDYRIDISNGLIRKRSRVQLLRLQAIDAFRTNDIDHIHLINDRLINEIGCHLNYTDRLSNTFLLLAELTPNWGIQHIRHMGGVYHICLFDKSGRNRETFHNKWVTSVLEHALIYTILSVYLIDVNTHIGELHGLSN